MAKIYPNNNLSDFYFLQHSSKQSLTVNLHVENWHGYSYKVKILETREEDK